MSHQPNDLGNYIPRYEKDRQRKEKSACIAAASYSAPLTALFGEILKSTMKRQVEANSMTPLDYDQAFAAIHSSEPKHRPRLRASKV